MAEGTSMTSVTYPFRLRPVVILSSFGAVLLLFEDTCLKTRSGLPNDARVETGNSDIPTFVVTYISSGGAT
jgi:hypothetical protein